MATERQIQANRANALKSTGPKTPEGKRTSSRNAARRDLVSGTVVFKGESSRRFNELAAALVEQFQPRNSVEISMVQTMTVARWRQLRMWGIQTAGFESEMANTRKTSAASGAVLAAATFRALADNSRVLGLQHRLEAAYDRQYNRALVTMLKLRETPDASAASLPAIHLVTETWDDDPEDGDFQIEPDSEPASETGSQPS